MIDLEDCKSTAYTAILDAIASIAEIHSLKPDDVAPIIEAILKEILEGPYQWAFKELLKRKEQPTKGR